MARILSKAFLFFMVTLLALGVFSVATFAAEDSALSEVETLIEEIANAPGASDFQKRFHKTIYGELKEILGIDTLEGYYEQYKEKYGDEAAERFREDLFSIAMQREAYGFSDEQVRGLSETMDFAKMRALEIRTHTEDAAERGMKLYFKGVEFKPTDEYKMLLMDSRIFIPLRYFGEELGYEVSWNEEAREITLFNGAHIVEMYADKRDYTVDGEEMEMDVAPFIWSDRTYVPIRFAAEALGEEVSWDPETRVASVGAAPEIAGKTELSEAEKKALVVQAAIPERDLNESKAWQEKMELNALSRDLQEGMDSFYESSMAEFLSSNDKENLVYSPLNLYIALSMLAETTAENTQAEILKALGVSDLKTLEERVDALWQANYSGTGKNVSLLANSIWMNEELEYKEPVLKTLAEKYHASSFSGEMGSDEINKALQDWTNENTGGLLKDAVSGMKTDRDTVLEMVSTIFFKAAWTSEFWDESTKDETFHGSAKESTVSMMHDVERGSYYEGTAFQAVSRGLGGSGSMYFILPKDGQDLNKILSGSELTGLLRGSGDLSGNWTRAMVHSAIPKFSLNSKIDLKKGLENMGMKDVQDKEKANFTPLTTFAEEYPTWLDKAEHAAMVEIDEKGVTGAAYTDFGIAGATAVPETLPDVYLTFDRPFIYAVVAQDGSILFSGTVWDL